MQGANLANNGLCYPMQQHYSILALLIYWYTNEEYKHLIINGPLKIYSAHNILLFKLQVSCNLSKQHYYAREVSSIIAYCKILKLPAFSGVFPKLLKFRQEDLTYPTAVHVSAEDYVKRCFEVWKEDTQGGSVRSFDSHDSYIYIYNKVQLDFNQKCKLSEHKRHHE